MSASARNLHIAHLDRDGYAYAAWPRSRASRSGRRAISQRRTSSHPEILAEIEAAHIRIRDDLLGRAFGQDVAGVDDVRPVDQPQRLTHVVVRNQNADP